MARLFGTDGVRGVANEELTPQLAMQLGQAGAYVLTKENADYIGMDISDYLALTPEQKLKANDKIGNGHAGDSVNRRFDQLLEDIHEAVKAVK